MKFKNKTNFNLLLVEDTNRHLQDALNVIKTYNNNGHNISVDTAINLETSKKLLGEHQYNAILTDLFYPYNDSFNQEGVIKGWSPKIRDECIDVLCQTKTGNDYYDEFIEHCFNIIIKRGDSSEKFSDELVKKTFDYTREYSLKVGISHVQAVMKIVGGVIPEKLLELKHKYACLLNSEWARGISMHPSGLYLINESIKYNIPVAVCTDVNSHNQDVNAIINFSNNNNLNVKTFTETYDDNQQEILKKGSKYWDKALDYLISIN